MLAKSVLDPVGHLERLAGKSTTRAYGAKLLSYQMVQVQRLRDPAGFLGTLAGRGFRFVHLTRDTFSQVLSLSTAQSRRVFHRAGDAPPVERLVLDVEDFLRRLEWSDMLLEYERHCLAGLPVAEVSYEADLLPPERHQATADRLFAWIGVPSAPVAAGLRQAPARGSPRADRELRRARAGDRRRAVSPGCCRPEQAGLPAASRGPNLRYSRDPRRTVAT